MALFHSFVSFRLAVRWGSHDYGLQDTTVCSNDTPRRTGILISKCNLSFLPHRTVFFIFVLLKFEAYKIALIWQI